ncbi:MAG: creatininase family protein [Pseudomonadota bacterium]
MGARWWAELSAREFASMDMARAVAVLPTAAIEQHGPHLPVGVDAMIAEGMLSEAMPLVGEGVEALVLPVQAVGKSNEHVWAPGTLTLTAEGLLSAWLEIGLSVARAGARRLVIVNSHGGNLDPLGVLARELRVRAGMLAVRCQWGSFGLPDGLIGEGEQVFGIHGGEVETALMLHFRPDLVDMARAERFRSSAEDMAERWLRPTGGVAYGWIAKDLNPAGAVGDASKASAETGRRVAAHQARGLAELVGEVATVDLERFAAFAEATGADGEARR